jgi:hypothetical protein
MEGILFVEPLTLSQLSVRVWVTRSFQNFRNLGLGPMVKIY